jgi:hypothetical protein
MSALSLQYPKKPVRLADDLEAFVYVIVYMALRYQRHDLSPDCDLDIGEEALAELNSTNNGLATRVHYLFCDSFECKDSYRGGGQFKIDKILLQDIPVELDADDDGNPTPLAQLLDRLYGILHTHYCAVDYSRLKQYEGERLKKSKKTRADAPKAPKVNPTRRRRFRCGNVSYDGDTMMQQNDSEDEPDQPPFRKPYRRKAALPSTPNPARLVLDTHASILRAFHGVFEDRAGNERDVTAAMDDKFVDQFLGLQALLGVAPQKPTTVLMKRTAPGDPGDAPVNAKRFCRRLDISQNINFKNSLEAIPEDAVGEE